MSFLAPKMKKPREGGAVKFLAGLEPASPGLANRCSSIELQDHREEYART